MKVTVDKKRKKFTPINLNIKIESLEEQIALYMIFNYDPTVYAKGIENVIDCVKIRQSIKCNCDESWSDFKDSIEDWE